MTKRPLLLVFATLALFARTNAQNYFTESFDGTTFPPTSWTTILWYNAGSDGGGCNCVDWKRCISNGGVEPLTATHSGAGMAWYNSWDIYWDNEETLISQQMNFSTYSSGTNVASFWIYRCNDWAGGYESDWIDVYAYSPSLGYYYMNTIYDGYLNPPSESAPGWYQYSFTFPTIFNTYNNVSVAFDGISEYYVDQYLDDVSVNHFTPCSGTPSVTASGPALVCPNTDFTLSASTVYISGLTYQWQLSTTSATGPWTSISGATNINYTVTGGITTQTYYRVVATCTSSSGSTNSNAVTVGINTPANCPCVPIYTTGCGTGIMLNTVTLIGECNTAIKDTNTGCSVGSYDIRTALPPVKMYPNTTYNGFMNTQSTAASARIWIDFNDDGVFAAGESVGTLTSLTASPTLKAYSITIPSGAALGSHRMRMRAVNGATAPGTGAACSSAARGEVHDYQINIIAPTPTITSNNTPFCEGSTLTLGASSTVSGTFNWTGPNSFSTSTGPSTTSSVSRTAAPYADSGNYVVTVTVNSVASCPANVNAIIYQSPAFTSVTSNSPVCSGNTLNLFSTTVTPASLTSYAWTGPGGFTSNLRNPTRTATTTAMSGTYNVTATSNGCITNGSTSVTINQSPNITSATGTGPTSCTCNCGFITLTGLNASTAYTVNYRRNTIPVTPFTLTSSAAGVITISGLTAATYDNITVTINSTNCVSNTVGPIVLSNPSTPPTPVVNSNSPVCLNSNLNFTGTVSASGLTWTWTGPNSFSFSNSGTTSNPSRTLVPFIDSGNYFIYVTDANGCTSPTVIVNVQILPRPNTPTVSSNNAALPNGICAGQTLNVTMSTTTPPGTAATIAYSWTDPVGGTAYPSTPGVNTLSVPNTPANFAGNWTVYSVLNGCRSTSPVTFYTYIKPVPGLPTVSSNSPICSGQGYNPNYMIFNVSDTTPGVSYTWGGPASITPNPNTKNIDTITNPATSATGTYTVFATKNGCNSPSASTSVVVNATPGKPTANPSFTAYCQFQPTVPLTATGTNLVWHMASTGGPGTPIAPTPSDTLPGLYIYYVTQSTVYGAKSCESQPANDTVLVKAKPPLPYGIVNYTYCQGDNAPLFNMIGANLLWYSSATGGIGNPATPAPSTATPGTFYYYVTQTVNGCESDRLMLTVVIKPKPAKPTVQNKTYCQFGIAVPLVASGSNLLWYTTSSGGVGSTKAPIPNTLYEDTIYYYVTQTVDGCESDRAQLIVIVDYTPNALIVGNQPYVCQHDSMEFTYYGNALPDAIFNWSMPGGATLLSGSPMGPIRVKFDSAGKRIVSLQVIHNNCKSPLTSYALDVREAPVAPTNIKHEVCQNDILDVSLGYANIHIDKFDWDFDGAEVIYGSEGGPYGIRWSTSGQHVVTMVAYSATCPSIPTHDTVNVHPLADARIGDVSKSNICAGDSVVFVAERYNPAYLYQWEPSIYFGTQNNQGQVYGFIERSGYVILKVTTEFGCTSMDSTIVTAAPCCEVYFPNAFTPNGDGKNDVFRPISKGNQVYKTFRVTNRWGQVMFETVNPKVGWDGKFNGVLQDIGTYYYLIQYACANGKSYEEKGEILLIK